VVEAFVLLRVGAGESWNFARTVKEEVSKVDGVKEAYGVFGRYDLVVRIEAKTLEALGSLVTDHIRGIRGVVNTETLVIGF